MLLYISCYKRRMKYKCIYAYSLAITFQPRDMSSLSKLHAVRKALNDELVCRKNRPFTIVNSFGVDLRFASTRKKESSKISGLTIVEPASPADMVKWSAGDHVPEWIYVRLGQCYNVMSESNLLSCPYWLWGHSWGRGLCFFCHFRVRISKEF